jgi:hypothetical protein
LRCLQSAETITVKKKKANLPPPVSKIEIRDNLSLPSTPRDNDQDQGFPMSWEKKTFSKVNKISTMHLSLKIFNLEHIFNVSLT